jgi:uncharacterized protein
MSVEFNLAQFLKSGVGGTREYEFASSGAIDLGDASATDVRGQVKFTLTNFGVLASIRLTAALHLTCARCLEPFDLPVESSFEEEYQPTIDIATGLPAEFPKSDTAFQVPQTHTIDLAEAIRQNLVLAVDIIPVCSPECRGFCPGCGVNRNLEACACPPPQEASPFAVLQGLLAESESDG